MRGRWPPNLVHGQHGQQERLARINQIGIGNAASRDLHHVDAVVVPPQPLSLVAVSELRLRDAPQTVAVLDPVMLARHRTS